MAAGIAVQARGLGKRYRTRANTAPYQTLRESLTDLVMRRTLKRDRSGGGGEFWALRDVSFELSHGEALGIIGRNGVGKSTLLKLLSRITEPTEGRLELEGRVGALLEVGTGFHPELSGRENVYLSGAILGMSRADIRQRFDEIVAFAEVTSFLDLPVKRYSSGMYMRLAFSVAAHLEPDILIVDEVLAVGDAAFQRKCLGKMGDVAGEGRTVLFVSHNMPAIARLCTRALLISSGKVVADGPAVEVVARYLNSDLGVTAIREWPDLATAPGNDIVRLRRTRVRLEDGRTASQVDVRQRVGIELQFDVLSDGVVITPNLLFRTDDGVTAFVAIDVDPTWRGKPRSVGRYITTAWIPGNLLAEGHLVIDVVLSTFSPSQIHVQQREAISLQVFDPMEGDTARGDYGGTIGGVLRPLLDWTTSHSPMAPSGP